jgi:hypothetical protein
MCVTLQKTKRNTKNYENDNRISTKRIIKKWYFK